MSNGVITVVGRSMRPLLPAGSRVQVQPLDRCPRLGQILVFKAGDRLVVHRLIHVRETVTGAYELITKGDLSARIDDPIPQDQVVGHATHLLVWNRWIPLNHAPGRVAGRLLARWGPEILSVLRSIKALPKRLRPKPFPNP